MFSTRSRRGDHSTFMQRRWLVIVAVVTTLFSSVPALGQPPPIVEFFSPEQLAPGGFGEYQVFGNGFQPGANVEVTAPGVLISSINVVDPGIIEGQLTVEPSAPPGIYDVIVTNPDAQADTGFGLIEVIAEEQPPQLDNCTPDSGYAGETVPVVITGQNFVDGGVLTTSHPSITVFDVNVVSPSEIHATFQIDNAATLGPVDITYENPSTLSGTGVNLFTVMEPPQPVIDGIDPGTIESSGADTDLLITGQNFTATTEVQFSCTAINIVSTQFFNAAEVVVTVNVLPGTPDQTCDVALFTEFGETSCPGCVEIVTPFIPPPTVGSVDPDSVTRGSGAVLTITGTNFEDSPTIGFGCSGVSVGTIQVLDPNTIIADVTVAPTTALGPCDVSVTTSGGTGDCIGCFTIIEESQPPLIESVSPDSLAQGTSGNTITITGSGFTPTTEVSTSCTGVSFSSVIFISETTIQAVDDVAGDAPLGPCDVFVSNAFGTDMCSGCLVVVEPPPEPPVIESVSPDSLVQGTSGNIITISGSGFTPTTDVSTSCTGVSFSTVNFISETMIQAVDDVAGDASLGPCDVFVSNETGTDVCTGCIEIVEAPPVPPVIESVSPDTLVQGSDGNVVTITGTDFTPTTEVSTTCPGVTITSTFILGETTVQINADVAADASLGLCGLVISTEGGTDQCTDCLEIVAAPPGEPTIASVSPDSVVQGDAEVLITINGTEFLPGAIVSTTCPGIAISNTNVVDESIIEVTVDVSPSATPGGCDVLVTTDGGTANCPGCLTIVELPPDAPVITNVDPSTLLRGATDTEITINGSGFLPGSVVDVACSDVTVQSVTVESENQITAVIDVSANAALTNCDVSVTTSAGSDICAECVSVEALPPTIESVDPDSLMQGEMGTQIVITGTDLDINTVVELGCAGIDLVNIDPVRTSITATVNVAPDATLGPCDISVTTDFGVVTCGGCVTIYPPPPETPVVTAALPDTITVGRIGVELTISGENFTPDAVVEFNCEGVTVRSTQFVSQSQIISTIDVAPSTLTGPCGIRVTTDGGTGECEACITILPPPLEPPLVTSVSPDQVRRSAPDVTLAISGDNFTEDATVSSSCPSITVQTVSFVSETEIEAVVSVAADAQPDLCDIVVTTEAGTGTCAGCVQITLPPPSISNVTPATVRRGDTDVEIQFSGSGFFAPATLELACDGVTLGSPSVASETHIITNITVSDNAPLGACDVSLITEWGDAVCVGCLTIIESEPPTGYDYTQRRSVTIFPHSPGDEFGEPAVLTETRPFFDWDADAVGVDPSDVRFKINIFPAQMGQQAVSDIVTNVPTFTVPGIEATTFEFPPYLDPLEMGEDYVWFVQAYDVNDPAQSIIGSSEFYNFEIADIPERDTLPPDSEVPEVTGHITMLYPGGPCDESDPGGTYSTYGYESIFRLRVSPDIVSVNIIEWFVPCGYVPVDDIIDLAVPTKIKGPVDLTGTTSGPVTITESTSDHNTVEVALPDHAPPMLPGGAYVWTAMGTLSDGSMVSAGEYWCFRNGDIPEIYSGEPGGTFGMPEDHVTRPVPRDGETGTTSTPEQPEGTTERPPQEEPPRIPGEGEPPPEVRCDECQVSVYPEDCDQIRIEPVPPTNPQDFDYPRAVPLLIVGDDADRIVTLCQNCGYSYHKKAVKDDIASYEWELQGKGSLNDPFPDPTPQQKLLDSLQALLDSLKAELAKVEARIARLEAEIPGVEQDSAAAARIVDSLKVVRDDVNAKVAGLSAAIADVTAQAAAVQEWLNAAAERARDLRDSLRSRPSPEELTLFNQLEALRSQLDALNEQLVDLYQTIQDETNRRQQVIPAMQAAVDQARANLDGLTGTLGALQSQISALVAQLYASAPEISRFRSSFSNFNYRFCGINADANNAQLSEFMSVVHPLIRARTQSRRDSLATIALSQLSGLELVASRCCVPGDAYCAAQLHDVQRKADSLRAAIEKWQRDGSSGAPGIVRAIDSLSGVLSSTQTQLDAFAAEVDGRERALGDSIAAFTRYVEEADAEMEVVKAAIDAKTIETDSMQVKLDEAIAERKAEFERKRPEWEETLAAINDSVLVREDSLSYWTDSLQVVRDSLNAAVADSTDIAVETEEADTRLATISSRLQQLRGELDEKKKEKDDLEKRVAELEKQLDEERAQLDSLVITSGTKNATGQTAYYIPPPIDYIIAEDAEKQREYDSLKADLKKKEALYDAAFRAALGWQAEKYRYFESYARDAYRGKQLLKSIGDMESRISELEMALSDRKSDMTQERLGRYEEAVAAIDSALEKLGEREEEINEDLEDGEDDKDSVETEIENVEDSLTVLRERADLLRTQIADRQAEVTFHSEQASRGEATYEQRRAALQEARSQLVAAEQEMRAARSRVSSGTLADNETVANQGSAELIDATSRHNALEAEIATMVADLRSNANSIEANRQALGTANAAHDSLRVELGKVERAIRSLTAAEESLEDDLSDILEWLRKLEEQLSVVQSKKSDFQQERQRLQAATTEQIEAEIENDQEVKDAKTQMTDLRDAIKANLEELERLNGVLAENVQVGPHIRDSVEAKRKEAYDEFVAAEKALREFLLNCIEEMSFTDTIHVTVDDMGLIYPDDERRDERAFLVEYSGWNVKVTPRVLDGAQCADEMTSDICSPSVTWETNGAIAPLTGSDPQLEPRTTLLLFDEGRLLWPEWHQAPADQRYRHEVVTVERIFTDKDAQLNICASEVCKHAKLPATWSDVVYTQFQGLEVTNTAMAEKVFFKVPPIPKDPPACDTLEKFFSIGDDSPIADDKELKLELMYTHYQSTFVEKIDSIVAAPESTVTLKIRLTDTEAKGTPNEDVRVSIDEFKPDNQDGHGIDEPGTMSKEFTTDGSGYVECKLILGKEYGEYEIKVEYIRNKDKPRLCEEFRFPVKVPLYHEEIKFGFGPYPLTAELKDAWESGVSDIEAIPAELDTLTGNRILAAVTCLHDFKGDSVNGIDIEFEGRTDDGAVSFEPEVKTSEWWGIARSVVQDHPDTVRLLATATVKNEDLHPFTRIPVIDMEYTGRTANMFRIGIMDDLFTVETDESFVPGDEINGTGRFVLDVGSPILQPFIDELIKIKLQIRNVVTNEDDVPLALSGLVEWSGDPLVFEIGSRYGFEISALGVEAGAGGVLKGSGEIKATDTTDAKTVSFEAYFGSQGDFIADIKSLPLLDFGFAQIKEGASAVIDMSRRPISLSAPVPDGPAWMGLYIRRMDVALPALMRSDPPGADPPGVFAEAFYLGTQGGLNGTIGAFDVAKDINLMGYLFSLDTLSATFDNGSLAGCAVAGKVTMKDPVHGTLGLSLNVSSLSPLAVSGHVRSINPLAIPKWGMTLDLIDGCSFSYDELAEVTLNFNARSKYFEKLTIRNFKVNSNYEMSLEGFAYAGTPQKFMDAFEYHIQNLDLHKDDEDKYELELVGMIGFPDLVQLQAGIRVQEGPAVAVDSIGIDYSKGPVSYSVMIGFSEREFKGAMDVVIEPRVEVSGQIVIGSAEKGDGSLYDYWYIELVAGLPTGIPIGNTGLSLYRLGGGVGVHYRPPVGDDPGGPDHRAALGLKAVVVVGDAAGGKVMSGQLTMVFANPRFTLNGKVWVMDMEDNCYGEGQVSIVWDPRDKIEGYIRCVIALPTAAGELVSFRGDVQYCFGDCGGQTFFIKSRELSGTALIIVGADGEIDINQQYCYLSGDLRYSIDKEVSAAGFGFAVDAGISAGGTLQICYIEEVSLSSELRFSGWADVDLLVARGAIDILSANVSTTLGLSYRNSVCVAGDLHVDYDVLLYSGSHDLSLSYPEGCSLYQGCR